MLSTLDFDVLKISECPSLSRVFETIKRDEFQHMMVERTKSNNNDESNKKVIALNFEIIKEFTDNDFNEINMERCIIEDRDNLMENIDGIELSSMLSSEPLLFEGSNPMLISFRSMKSGKCKIFWKTSVKQDFLSLSITNYQKMENETIESLSSFIINFLINELRSSYTGKCIINLKMFDSEIK